MIAIQVIFWICIFLIFYSYVLFPALLSVLAKRKRSFDPFESGQSKVPEPTELPRLSVLIAAHNEESVIESKIRSVLSSDYPGERVEILLGSDDSTDRTNEIILKLEQMHPRIRTTMFHERTGKPGVVNKLAEQAEGEILIITDANVLLDETALSELAGTFSDPRIGLVDSRMVHTRVRKDGISFQENFYISREVRIKHHESVIWGTMMGPFGGCYAVRSSLYTPVPENFLVDDFYINMSVLRQGFACVSNTRSLVYEDVSNDPREEFRRKKRISAGNFQNISRFASMLFSGKKGVSLCFFSHKVIRWFVPFLVILTLTSSLILGRGITFYAILALLQIMVLVIPVIDHFLRIFKIHLIPLRFISHFVLMNLALLGGFIRYTGGIKTNVWQPTKRNQVQA